MDLDQRRADIASSAVYLAILEDRFEQSQGIEDLRMAIEMKKPLVLFSHPEEHRRHPLPQEFIDYTGPKLEIATIISEENGDEIMRSLLHFLRAHGVEPGRIEIVEGRY